MSKKNRKYEYDRLVTAGRFKDIDKSLIAEFGEPTPVIEEPKKEVKKVKKGFFGKVKK